MKFFRAFAYFSDFYLYLNLFLQFFIFYITFLKIKINEIVEFKDTIFICEFFSLILSFFHIFLFLIN